MKSEHGYFPLFVNLSGRRILVVGAGTIALRRIKVLLQFGAELLVAAVRLHPEVERLVEEGTVKLTGNEFEPWMLEEVFMVLACTDDQELNSGICKKAQKAGIFANNCSNQEECDFFFPSVVKQGELVLGINAGGTDHRKVKKVREQMEQILGGNDADYNRNQGEPSGIDTK